MNTSHDGRRFYLITCKIYKEIISSIKCQEQYKNLFKETSILLPHSDKDLDLKGRKRRCVMLVCMQLVWVFFPLNRKQLNAELPPVLWYAYMINILRTKYGIMQQRQLRDNHWAYLFIIFLYRLFFHLIKPELRTR